MELAEYARIADAEDAHWWYRATRALMRDLLAPELRPGVRVLDAGCGPGGNSAWLAAYGDVVGIDSSPEAVRLARERHPEIEVEQGDIEELPFPDHSFDIALAITVLTLVENDGGAVAELARVVKPGGAVLLMEPAIPRLRRDHDAVIRALRRYRLADLARLAEDARLAVRRATYAYSFLLPAAAGLSIWHRMKPRAVAPRSDLQRDRLGAVFGRLAAVERRVLARRDVPIGLSVLVLAESP
jgi:ubiquinone/menaquinone biosynthesis C-methylase UbiE